MNHGAHFGRVVSGRDVAPVFRVSADVVIIGTGAGGSMAFHDLARAGVSVVAIERGSFIRPNEMNQREDVMIPKLFAESGARSTADMGITVLQGQGVGGSTLHNTNLCKRLPAEVLREWEERFDLHFPGIDDDFDAVESMLGVHPVADEDVNANNDVLMRGIQALGYRGGRLSHNRDDRCQRSGFCELGCAYNGKLNALRMLIPPAVAAGGLVLADARAEHIELRGDRVTSVSGRLMDRNKNRPVGEFHIAASAVILAGSATGSASLHMKSGLPDPNGLAGRGLHMHPGAAVMGLHADREIRGWEGTPQSIECTQFLDFAHGAQERVWIVSGFAHPAGAAGLVPGFGPEHADIMRRYAHASVAIAMVHDESSGRVHPAYGDHIKIRYTMDAADRAQMALGLRESARLLLAGGAGEVMIPLGRPLFVRDPSELEAITADTIQLGSPWLTAVHPMSTLRMAADPERGVVDADGRHHHVPNLFVADGSLFPTSIGGPPQIGIYTFGRRVARAVVVTVR